ncbi:MAG: hypothetical protein A2Y95_02900 [Deltaproteobacteria bacterium RBG_13_65_10]|jgi:hypothetical protein|nr:MAG: hypothetical protein A2Y95_02900 [Deltaproteobacteria bacterium RBG_13_65_10]
MMLQRFVFAGTLLLAVVAFMANPVLVNSQPSSSSCLGTPTDAVNAWRSMFPSASNEKDCLVVCNAWRQTCVNQAYASFRCFASLFNSLSQLERAQCSTLGGSAKMSCISDQQNTLRNENEGNQSDLNSALGQCNSGFSDCLENCIDD